MSEMGDCWEVLPKVSKSFSLCIRVLPEPLHEQMMLSYLIYRAIDTIEDSQVSPAVKKAMFEEFVSTMRGKNYPAEKVLACKTRMLKSLDYTYEKDLLERLDSVIKAYYLQPVRVRAAIRKWGRVMAKGMCEFQSKKIDTFKDQDRYSYYVAGVVGYLFNDLLYVNEVITLDAKKHLHRHARKFGLALQKVNILRDVAHDIPQKRFYWPVSILNKYELNYQSILQAENRSKAMKVLREEIDDALQYIYSGMYYIMSLPQNALRVRMFCLIPLFMAIESYIKCIDNRGIFDSGKTVKIDRAKVHDIVAKSTLWGTSNKHLLQWFTATMGRAQPGFLKTKYGHALLELEAGAGKKN